jgi:hypothetical protein
VNIEEFTEGREAEWAARVVPGVNVDDIARAMKMILDALATK